MAAAGEALIIARARNLDISASGAHGGTSCGRSSAQLINGPRARPLLTACRRPTRRTLREYLNYRVECILPYAEVGDLILPRVLRQRRTAARKARLLFCFIARKVPKSQGEQLRRLSAPKGKGAVDLRAVAVTMKNICAAPSGDGGVAGALLPGAPLLWALAGAGAACLAAVARWCGCRRTDGATRRAVLPLLPAERDAGIGTRRRTRSRLTSPAPSTARCRARRGLPPSCRRWSAAAAFDAGTLLAPGPTTLLADDPQDNPDVVPFANEMDLPRALLKALDPSGAGGGGRALALDSPSQAPLYENLGSLAPSPVTRWPPPPPAAAPQLPL
ncbi:Protein of unknown function [Gryllus bimaculatus]|nr:Protein of unknown function [Gryllus bimaculatus]